MIGTPSSSPTHAAFRSIDGLIHAVDHGSIPSKPIESEAHQMAKLYLSYAAMNAGKSTMLLSVAHTYQTNGGTVLLFTSAIDNRSGVGKISSRIGISADAVALGEGDDVFDIVSARASEGPIAAVLMDEVQFMTSQHIEQAARVVDELDIPVMAYGLKNNVFGRLFSESMATLLALADEIREIRTTCHCQRKANMILRYSPSGAVEKSGVLIEIGGESRYVSVCRKHWMEGDIGPRARAGLPALAS